MLRGSLTEFSLHDLFGLLSATRKTGVLYVQATASEGRVWFRDGRVVIASTEAGPGALLERLAADGVIERDRVESLSREHADAPAPVLGQALVGLLGDEAGKTLLRELAASAVQALLSEGGGSFSFDARIDTETWADGVVEVSEVLAEAERRREVWQRLRERVGPANGVPVLRPAAADDRDELTVTADQWRMLARLDGRRDVAALSAHDSDTTYTVLVELLDAGLIELDTSAREPETVAELRGAGEDNTGLHPVAAGAFADLGLGADQPAAEGLGADQPAAEQPPAELSHTEQPHDEAPAEASEAHDEAPADQSADARERSDHERPIHAVGESPAEALTRDQEIDRALVLRLIDGVKEA